MELLHREEQLTKIFQQKPSVGSYNGGVGPTSTLSEAARPTYAASPMYLTGTATRKSFSELSHPSRSKISSRAGGVHSTEPGQTLSQALDALTSDLTSINDSALGSRATLISSAGSYQQASDGKITKKSTSSLPKITTTTTSQPSRQRR